jgi:GNAT superfamily N-acetyltransferase
LGRAEFGDDRRPLIGAGRSSLNPTTMKIRIAESDSELERAGEVLRELRPHFTSAEHLVCEIRRQRWTGYQVAYGEANGEVICVAGFVVSTKLACGKHMYVDDLVTAESFRSSGAGSRMMDWLKSHARQLGCRQLHLDSGVQRFAAHRFYLRHGFDITSHHFVVDLAAD